MAGKVEPKPTPVTQPFWDGTKAGELRIQHCDDCGEHVFYPRSGCPYCASTALSWVTASGDATLDSYVISHHPAPGFEAPYVIAIVKLAEGPRMLTNVVGVEPEPDDLPLDLPLRVTFEERGEQVLALFTPAKGAAK